MNDRRSAARIVEAPGAEAWTIGVLLAITVAARLYILPDRWINPDEGAHLMDAYLALHGYVPDIDFVSRQPLYVYAMAAFLGTTHVSLEVGRLFPLICSLLVGVPLYGLTRDVYGRGPAMLALAAWWMLPFEIRQSTVVKTEPFAMLLSLAAAYAAVRSVQLSRPSWMLWAGMFAAAGYYVRESTLVVPPSILVYVVWSRGRRMRETLQDAGIFVVGYTIVCIGAALLYSRWLGPSALITMTPVHFLAEAVRGAARSLVEISAEAPSRTSPVYGEDPGAYLRAVRDSAFYLLFLLVAAGFAGLHWLSAVFHVGTSSTRPSAKARGPSVVVTGSDHGGVGEPERSDALSLLTLALSWIALLALAYAWHFSQRGFWVDYARELAPPLIIAAVGWLSAACPGVHDRPTVIRTIAATVILGWLWTLFQSRFRDFYGIGHHASLGLVLFLLFWHRSSFPRRLRSLYALGLTMILVLIIGGRYTALAPLVSGSGGSVATMVAATAFVAWMLRHAGQNSSRELARSLPLGLVAGSLVVTLSSGALRFGVRFEGVWSTEALAAVTQYLRTTTAPEDRVMSGGVVWALEAHRLPWRLYSHPMSIQRILPAEGRRALTDAFRADPPEVIIMDKLTQRTFGPNVETFTSVLDADYRLIMEPGPASFPVAVYRRIRTRRASSARYWRRLPVSGARHWRR